MSSSRFDVLVVGAGPAGMAAAVRAAECGVSVGIVDDNSAFGGQIWRGGTHESDPERTRWSSRWLAAKIPVLPGTRVYDRPEPGLLLAEHADGMRELRYRKLILATGARERFLPFPGWTLPNVIGAGGLQAMVKSGLPIRGKRVVVAGTGPLLLAVAAYLKKQGAEIPLICEQRPWLSLVRFGIEIARFPGKVAQVWELYRRLDGIPAAANSWVVSAQGTDKLESVKVLRGGSQQTVDCDFLACGFHMVPNVELAVLLGCRLKGGFVDVNDYQETSVENIYCAGEPTGIGGVDSALVEGEIAGLAVAGAGEKARALFGRRNKYRRFGRLLEQTYRLRPELKKLPQAETIVCRCEDSRYEQVREHASWRPAKLQTRCGMGPCQGRICGPAAEFLFGWNVESVRPPIFPVRVESLAAATCGTNELDGGIE